MQAGSEKVHDARVFRNSPLFSLGERGLLPGESKNINGVQIPVHFIGDAAYPLLNWMMTPYKGTLSESQHIYNYKLSSARMVIEKSFGRLKARWRRFLKRFDGSIRFLLDVIVDCVILHNMCEVNKEACIEEWFTNENVLRNPDFDIESVRNIRNAITNFLC